MGKAKTVPSVGTTGATTESNTGNYVPPESNTDNASYYTSDYRRTTGNSRRETSEELVSFFGNFVENRTLSEAGRVFYKQLSDNLREKNYAVSEIQRGSVTMYAISRGNSPRKMFFAFAETFNNAIPGSITFLDSINAFKTANPSVEIITDFLVRAEDYDRVRQWINFIENTFINDSLPPTSSLRVDMLRGFGEPYINDDVNAIKAYVNAFWPHASIPRCDYGMLIENRSRERAGDEHQESRMPIFALLAWTEFMLDPGLKKIVPVVRTTVCTHTWHDRIVYIATALAAKMVMYTTKYFNHYRPGVGGKPSPLLDLPMPGQTGTFSSRFKDLNLTMDEFEMFVHDYFADPVLAMDFNAAEARLPILDSLASGTDAFVNEMYSFFGTPPVDQVKQNTVGYEWYEYFGTMTQHSKVISSRDIDFFWALENSTVEVASKLLNKSSNRPQDRRDVIASILPEMTFANHGLSMMLPADLAMFMAQQVLSKFDPYFPGEQYDDEGVIRTRSEGFNTERMSIRRSRESERKNWFRR